MPRTFSHPRRGLPVALAAGALLAPAPAPAAAGDLAALRAALSRETARLGPASGAEVVDLGSGQRLFRRRADRRLAPASNEKLFTTATALLQFGPGGTLQTTVRVAAGVAVDAKGVLNGDLYLVGDGDPSLGDTALKGLAERVVTGTGLRSITGGLVGDESVFDTRRGDYDSGYAPDDDLGGQLGGLTWGHGRASPGGPATVAAARLQFFLGKLGVRVTAPPRTGRAGEAPGGPGKVLGTADSPPMQVLIATTNQPSDNFYAETLLKDLGAHRRRGGSATEGLKVVRAQLRRFGAAPRVVDGSGLSRQDRASPHDIVTVLRALDRSAASTAFSASLAVPGRIGTLAKRMRGTAADGRCQAKTGTLRGISALSGYCRTPGDRVIAFSFLENDVDPLAAKAVEDRMVPAIAAYRP